MHLKKDVNDLKKKLDIANKVISQLKETEEMNDEIMKKNVRNLDFFKLQSSTMRKVSRKTKKVSVR